MVIFGYYYAYPGRARAPATQWRHSQAVISFPTLCNLIQVRDGPYLSTPLPGACAGGAPPDANARRGGAAAGGAAPGGGLPRGAGDLGGLGAGAHAGLQGSGGSGCRGGGCAAAEEVEVEIEGAPGGATAGQSR